MTKGAKALIIFFVVCFGMAIFGTIAELANKDLLAKQKEERQAILVSNYELIKEKILNPEEVNLESVTFNKNDKPSNFEDLNYVVIRKYQEKGKDITWEYTGSISRLDDLKYTKWTEEDLNSIPIIVFSISSYISKTYKYVYGGSGTPTIRSEKVDLYYYNTKTNTVFMHEEMKAKELPESTNSSHDYNKSIYDIDAQIKNSFGIYVMPSWLILLLVLGGMILVPTAIALIVNAIKVKAKKQK